MAKESKPKTASKKAPAPNSQECIYYGRKLGNICCDDIYVDVGYISIGSNGDDTIDYNPENPPSDQKGMLKERVTLTCINDGDIPDDELHLINIDLEDVLRWSAKYCRGIYDRVAKDVSPYDCRGLIDMGDNDAN